VFYSKSVAVTALQCSLGTWHSCRSCLSSRYWVSTYQCYRRHNLLLSSRFEIQANCFMQEA